MRSSKLYDGAQLAIHDNPVNMQNARYNILGFPRFGMIRFRTDKVIRVIHCVNRSHLERICKRRVEPPQLRLH